MDKTAVSLSRGDIPLYYIDNTHIRQSSQLLVVKCQSYLKVFLEFVMRFTDMHSLTRGRVGYLQSSLIYLNNPCKVDSLI